MEFLVLGPLEVRIRGVSVPLGGAKQRAVLAVLLLHADESVSVERLIDEVWGESPPPSAAHSLEAYVSRLRALVHGHGPSLARRGAGYALDLGGATLDAEQFEGLQSEADLALDLGDVEHASFLAAEAIALWRGPALPDVSLATGGRAVAERLEELRLRTLELRFDAELALGRHREVAGELQALVSQNPYRERFVEQLMLALYRSGRQAEALEVYEKTRAALADDLGLRPSEGLHQLSGQIVRQEPQLRHPTPSAPSRVLPGGARQRIGRVAGMVLAGAVVAATVTFTASGSEPHVKIATSSAPGAKRVALVLPRSPVEAIGDPRIRDTAAAFRESANAWGHESEMLVANEPGGGRAEFERVVRRLLAGGFALVFVLGDGPTAHAVAPVVGLLPRTHFVFIDASLSSLSLTGMQNATGMPYADQQTSQLMGYLSALVPPRGRESNVRVDMVSIVASPGTPRVERLVYAFERGARKALTPIAVRVDYAEDERDKTGCERLANDQIDAGSDVIFAIAGECSSAALAVAKLRGVWGIRANDDGVSDGPHILATTYKNWDKAIREAMLGLEEDTLPKGGDLALGLADDYAVDAFGSDAPEVHAVWSKVVRLCTRLRERSEGVAS